MELTITAAAVTVYDEHSQSVAVFAPVSAVGPELLYTLKVAVECGDRQLVDELRQVFVAGAPRR